MTHYLLDTNHASRAMIPASQLAQRLAETPDATFCLSVPAIGELWYMVHNSQRAEGNREDLQRLISYFSVIPFDLAAAEEFGRIRVEQRRIGKPIPQIDTQIAAIARVHQMVILSADSHFSHVANLLVENWLAT